jgi:transposase
MTMTSADAARIDDGVVTPRADQPKRRTFTAEWRKAAQAGAASALGGKSRDRRDREIEQLRSRAERAEAELAKTRAALDLVGQAHALLETLSESTDTGKRSQR